MSDYDKFSRRNLLKGLGAVCGLSLLQEKMTNQIVESFIGSAQADTGMLPNYRYINFVTGGGLPRWYFDLPLIPNGNDPFTPSKQVITSVKNGGDGKPIGEYAHTKMGDFYLPLMWSYDIPLSGGGTGKLDELASSALFIRGIDQGIDGHEFNSLRQNSPIPGGLTYTGIFADSGNTPVPAATTGGGIEHRSASNKALIPFAYRPDLKVLSNSFSLFKTTNPKSFNRRDAAQRTIEAALKSIQKTQGANSPYMNSIKENHDNAIELLTSNFDTIDAEYAVIYNKYQKLIMASLQIPLPGVTDIPIYAIANDPRFDIYIPLYNPGIRASDKTGDIQLAFQNILPSARFAHAFALAEFLITKNLSSSVVANLDFWGNFDIKNYNRFNSTTQKYDTFQDTSSLFSLGTDVHSTGTFPALIMFVRHFHSYATCLHELMTVLKAKNLYDQTLIHTTSEFNRSPRVNGSGSEHGFHGSATSVFSGRIKQPIVVGDIAKNSDGLGTWGASTNNISIGDRKINLGNVASTVCSIFDLPSPAKNDSPLITIDTKKNVITPTIKPKNIG